MEIATTIARNRRESVMGVKELLLQDLGGDLRQMLDNERLFNTEKDRGLGPEQAFSHFPERRGRT